MRIVAFVPDLMDRSRLSGREIDFVASASALTEEDADLYVVDLSRPGALDAIAVLHDKRVVGFGSHVDTDLLRAARAAGCDAVLARSAFFSHLDDHLASA